LAEKNEACTPYASIAFELGIGVLHDTLRDVGFGEIGRPRRDSAFPSEIKSKKMKHKPAPTLPMQTPRNEGSASPNGCSSSGRLVLLALVTVHMLGVLAEPLRFFSRSVIGEAPEFSLLASFAKPYSQWLYLDHGYFFFAPNPGPSHLLQCTLISEDKSGTSEAADVRAKSVEGSSNSVISVYPDRGQHWPRLLYHRYFMLSEFYNSRFAPSQVTDDLTKDAEFMARWNFDSNIYQQLQDSIKKSLKHSSGATRVTLRRLERSLPDRSQILDERLSTDDPRFIEILPESMMEPVSQTSPLVNPKSVEMLPIAPRLEGKR
jgi:hypothetical protein